MGFGRVFNARALDDATQVSSVFLSDLDYRKGSDAKGQHLAARDRTQIGRDQAQVGDVSGHAKNARKSFKKSRRGSEAGCRSTRKRARCESRRLDRCWS